MKLAYRVVAIVSLAAAAPAAAAAVAAAGTPHHPGRAAQAADPVISTVAGGDGGPAPGTSVAIGYGVAGQGAACPGGVTYVAGTVYVADGWVVRAVDTATDALTNPAGDGLTVAPEGDGGPATQAYVTACSAAVDGSGNLVVADQQRVRVVAASTGTFYGQAMTAGDIYTVAGNGTSGYSGDGGPATAAELTIPGGATVDSAGNLVIADTENNRIRVVAAATGTFYGQAMTAGDIYTVAGGGASAGDGGPATEAGMYPWQTAVDSAGNLVIADTENNRIRVVPATTGTYYGQAMTAGDIYTVAGDGTLGYSGDGGPAAAADLSVPTDLAVTAAGNLLIYDARNNRVREVTL